MADLQELFARLKAQSAEPPASTQPQATQPSIWAQPAAVSSPLFSPPIQTPNPIHSSDIISPVNPSSTIGSPAPDQNRNNLLNLLKFNNQAGAANAGPMANLQNVGAQRSNTVSGRTSQPGPLSAQDLVASLQRAPSASSALPSPLVSAGAERPQSQAQSQGPASGNQQDFLLNLLRRPNESKPVQSIETEAQPTQPVQPTQPTEGEAFERESTPVRQFGSTASRESTPFEAPQPTRASMFNYVNPFDQLHTSSPLNRTPKPEAQGEPKKIEILKHNRDTSNNTNGESSAPAAKSRRIEEPENKNQSVSQALEGVGEKVDKQVEQALAEAAAVSTKAAAPAGDNTADDESVIKKETADDDGVESSWESAEDSANDKKTEAASVKVYNFPMKPFVSIQIKGTSGQALPVRQEDNFMVIAKLNKEFDQMDRCLVTASQAYITYVQTATKKDNAGFRIIRQDTGDHKQVFRKSGERIFSVQICGSSVAGNDVEAVLGTGVNGTVFWTSLAKSRAELFADDDVESQGFIMPPVATAEENTSGSPVKTRAKCSSRHPEFFAMSRGKTIHIVSPDTVKDPAYCDRSSRKVNSEQYLAEHGLRINTGKAGKDFAFSEDDTVIVSLDKNGKVKFWDIDELTKRAADLTEGPHEPVELRDPLWQLDTAASGRRPDEKPSVSSIMLLDKERPHTKGVALRYMLVGFKQNHILQLWDLGLGKAVQELRLPHQEDSDGICSISYHPKTGIVAVGHPTRNSVYFIHLSAPKYNLPPMQQHQYVRALASGDKSVPKPESTAIMSGLREFSFSKVGQLRSVDMLKSPVDNGAEKGSDDEVLFELYAMHSKGVVGVGIKRADLGWDANSKMLHPVDAVAAGVVEVTELKLPVPKDEGKSEASSVAETPSKKKEIKKQPDPVKSSPAPAAAKPAIPEAAVSNGEQPAIKQIPEAPKPDQQPAANPPLMTADSYAMAGQHREPPVQERAVEAPKGIESAPAPVTAPVTAPAAAPAAVPENVSALLTKEFDSLYQRLDNDKRVSDASGAAKQDAMLRLVSSTLTENVERSLHNIINKSVDEKVIPRITETTSKIVEKKLQEMLPNELNAAVANDLKTSLPHALQQALRDHQLHRTISEQVGNKVQHQVSALLQQSMPGMVTQATQKMIADVEARTEQRLKAADAQRQQDNAKIDDLMEMVQSLSVTVRGLAEQVASGQQSGQKKDAPAVAEEEQPAEAVDPQKKAEEEEVERITATLMAGDYETATIQWLQSARQAELFDKLFVRVNPQYLVQVSPLVSLSVSAAITATFETNTAHRLDWLATVLRMLNLDDNDIRDVAPKILDVIASRLSGAYMQISESRPGDPSLRRISQLNRQVMEIRRVAA